MQVFSLPVLAALLSAISTVHATSEAEYASHAKELAQILLDKYADPNTGVLGGGWWNTAAAIPDLLDLQFHAQNTNPSVNDYASKVFDHGGDFLNDFYDDEGWWGLAWVSAFDHTRDTKYLQKAQSIWEDIKNGWSTGTGCANGGIWWDKKHTSNNAIENELFIHLSASLANRVPEKKAEYLGWGDKAWQWFYASGMATVQGGVVADGKNVSTCEISKNRFTYTNGVIVGALTELNTASPNAHYLDNATHIAHSAINFPEFLHNGILQEPTGATNDTMQFKGPFMRGIMQLHGTTKDAEIKKFILKNADSVWANRWPNGQIGERWDSTTGAAPWSSSLSSGYIAVKVAADVGGA